MEEVSDGKSRHENTEPVVKGDGESANSSAVKVKVKLPITSKSITRSTRRRTPSISSQISLLPNLVMTIECIPPPDSAHESL